MAESNHLLRAARERTPSGRLPNAHMSRTELAEAVNAWLHEHTDRSGALDDHYIGKLERGAVRWPGNDYRAGFRAVLKASSDAKLGFARSSGGNLEDVDRKTFLKTALGASAGVWMSQHVLASRDDPDGLALALSGLTAHYRRMEQAVSSSELAPAVEAHLRLASGVVRDSLPTATGYGVLSEVAGLSAWLAADRGDLGTARRRYAEAVHHAERTHHPLLISYMTASLGHFAVQSGDAQQGLRLLDRAASQLDSSAPDAARAWLASLHAVGYAGLGDVAATRAALTTAETLAARHRGEPRWPWVFVFDSAKAARYQASALGALGDARTARHAYEAAGIASLSPKPRALAQVEHAGALARAGMVGEGCALATEALATGHRYGSERVTAGVRDFRPALPSTAEAADLDAALAALYEES
jgi:hypothetical protein